MKKSLYLILPLLLGSGSFAQVPDIVLSNSNWFFSDRGLSEAHTLAPSQTDAFDNTDQITIRPTEEVDWAANSSYLPDDANDRVTWEDQSSFSLSITDREANGVAFKDAFLFTFNLTNTGAQTIDYDLEFAINLGSDGGTQIIETSSGDTTFNTGDTWMVTDDGPGSDPAVYTSWLSTDLTSASIGTDDITLTYTDSLTVGDTRAYSFLVGIEPTSTEAVQSAETTVIPEPASWPVVAGLSVGLCLCRRRTSRRAPSQKLRH